MRPLQGPWQLEEQEQHLQLLTPRMLDEGFTVIRLKRSVEGLVKEKKRSRKVFLNGSQAHNAT